MWSLDYFVLDIRTLNRLIKKYDLPLKKEKLIDLESELEQRGERLCHVIEDIEFHLNEKISNTIPIEVCSFDFYLSINFILDQNKDFLKEDPFFNGKVTWKEEEIDSYSLQFEIKGYSDDHDNTLYNCWHLDRDITGGGTPKFQHPFYHFQNGGKKMEIYNNDISSSVFTSAPRIPHPPMDLFLAFHFVITNFYNRNSMKNIDSILNDEEYVDLISRAQHRMWKPYYSAFNNGNHNDYTVDTITPLYTEH